jgi:dTMP kinase
MKTILAFLTSWLFSFRKPTSKPYIIVIEGLDGAGKETTTKALVAKLISRGYKVKTAAYPVYDKWHSFLVRYFLKGKFGKSPYSVPPRIASLFYSIDRFFHYHLTLGRQIREEEEATGQPYDFLILDRWTTASMLYQGAKEETRYHRISIAKYVEFVEYTLMRLPRPNKIFVLATTAEQSQDAMKNRQVLDINEKDLEYQQAVRRFLNELIAYYSWFPVATRNYEPPYEWYPVDDITEVIYGFIDHWSLRK